MTKKDMQEVAVQTTKRKGMTADIGTARIILPVNQSTLTVHTTTLVILARKTTAKRTRLL